eukprot:Anaeramoba_ignava/a11192_2.p1 GENE.a11192_2~~a11192_2.p1  ORF type:complete len:103 (+),score=8.40 a11192_2:68-376(+)
MPQSSFVKLTEFKNKSLKSSERVTLIRKGNQFFNNGKIDIAKRIFLTTGYTDGIIRVGDYYYNNNDYAEALEMYEVAPSPDKKDFLIEKMSEIVKVWLKNSI